MYYIQFEVVQFLSFLGLIIWCYNNMKNVYVVLKLMENNSFKALRQK